MMSHLLRDDAPLWVIEIVVGYFHLCGTLWFLRALVMVARLQQRCKVCLDRSGSSCKVAYWGGTLSGLRDAFRSCFSHDKSVPLTAHPWEFL